MNLIGYGLAKFDRDLAREFGCGSKSEFCRLLIRTGLAKTERAVLNRQDSFDPYFDNGRKGWHQRNQREHIKLFIDSLFGKENVQGLANIIKTYIKEVIGVDFPQKDVVAPSTISRFKLLQETGKEAEFFFMGNYREVPIFKDALIEDARLWGDGYDFQLQDGDNYYIVEVKGLRKRRGSVRLTEKEYGKASEYGDVFCLVVVYDLDGSPQISCVRNPLREMAFTPHETTTTQRNFHSDEIYWRK